MTPGDDIIGAALTEQERRHVARHLIAERLADVNEWLLWEDLPLLGEYEFERLVDTIIMEVKRIRDGATGSDLYSGVDGLAIIEALR